MDRKQDCVHLALSHLAGLDVEGYDTERVSGTPIKTVPFMAASVGLTLRRVPRLGDMGAVSWLGVVGLQDPYTGAGTLHAIAHKAGVPRLYDSRVAVYDNAPVFSLVEAPRYKFHRLWRVID